MVCMKEAHEAGINAVIKEEEEMSHEKGLEAAVYKYDRTYSIVDDYEAAVAAIIKAYLSASNQVLVPREPTEDMVNKARNSHEGESYLPYGLYHAMISAAPKPFQTPEESREKK